MDTSSTTTTFDTESVSSIPPLSYSTLSHSSAQAKQSDEHLLVGTVSFLIIILLVILMVFVYKKRQLKRQPQVNKQDPENTKKPFQEIDLDNFDIGNIDSLAPWERNAHLWINEQILSIKNENYE